MQSQLLSVSSKLFWAWSSMYSSNIMMALLQKDTWPFLLSLHKYTRWKWEGKKNLKNKKKILKILFDCFDKMLHGHSVWKSMKILWGKFTSWVDKSSLKMPKMVQFGKFAVKQQYQICPFSKRDIMVKNTKIQKLKCDIFGNYQTMCLGDWWDEVC